MEQLFAESNNMQNEHVTINKDFVVTVKVPEFSDDEKHSIGNAAAVDCRFEPEDCKNIFEFQIYPNGSNIKKKRYVYFGVLFNSVYEKLFEDDLCEICIFISVLDIKGEKRFIRSFACSRKCGCHTICLEKYIARDALLNEPEEFLSDNCLTVQFDVTLRRHSQLDTSTELDDLINSSFEPKIRKKQENTGIYSLHLDSVVARELYELSSAFKSIWDCHMSRNKTKFVDYSYNDALLICRTFQIHMGYDLFFHKIEEIFQLYKFAAKFDLPIVIEVCRRIMKSFLFDKSFPEIIKCATEAASDMLELSNQYYDWTLECIVEEFFACQNESVEESKRKVHILKKDLKIEWDYALRMDFFQTRKLNCKVIINILNNTKERFKSRELDDLINSSFQREIQEQENTGTYSLLLNSAVANKLYETSIVFREVCDCPIDNDTRSVKFPYNEALLICRTFEISMGFNFFFHKIEEVFELYKFADKYEISSVIELCRKIMKSFLFDKSFPEIVKCATEAASDISELSNLRNDVILKGIVEEFLLCKSESVEESKRRVHILKQDLGIEWNYALRTDFFETRKLNCEVIINSKQKFKATDKRKKESSIKQI